MAEGRDKVPHRDRKRVEQRRVSGSKKNTKKWCRGHVGREHVPVCQDYQPLAIGGSGRKIFVGWKVLVCAKCGRHLDHYYGGRLSRSQPKPEWVK